MQGCWACPVWESLVLVNITQNSHWRESVRVDQVSSIARCHCSADGHLLARCRQPLRCQGCHDALRKRRGEFGEASTAALRDCRTVWKAIPFGSRLSQRGSLNQTLALYIIPEPIHSLLGFHSTPFCEQGNLFLFVPCMQCKPMEPVSSFWACSLSP